MVLEMSYFVVMLVDEQGFIDSDDLINYILQKSQTTLVFLILDSISSVYLIEGFYIKKCKSNQFLPFNKLSTEKSQTRTQKSHQIIQTETYFPMHNDVQPQNRVSQQSTLSKTTQTYQIQPFQIQLKSLSHKKVLKMIQKWDTFQRIQEKFSIWGFCFQYEKILKVAPEEFYKAAINYVFLKKLHHLIKDFDQGEVLKQSLILKDIYKVQAVKGKLKGKRFDYLLLVTVKLIGFFLGSHTRQIIINDELQAQIYTILVSVLLGTQVGQKTFSYIQQRYKKKPQLKYNRSSQLGKLSLVQHQSKKSSQHKSSHIKSTAISKKRIGRCEFRSGTALFREVPENEDRSYIEMKELLKTNLVVKEFVPKPKPKETLDEVLAKKITGDVKLSELREVRAMEKREMKKKKIDYTQMSVSLDLTKSSQSLNVLHNHSMSICPQKKSKYYKLMTKQDLKLPYLTQKQQSMPILSNKAIVKHPEPILAKPQNPQNEANTQGLSSYQKLVHKKKQAKYWKKIIGDMKENNRLEEIEKFPPINLRMYFKNGELDDEKLRKSTASVNCQESPSYSSNEPKNSDCIEQQPTQENPIQFLTQKAVQTPRIQKTLKTIPPNPTLKTIKQSLASQTKKRILNQTKTSIKSSYKPLKQTKDCINIVQYSIMTNEKQIYKVNDKFMNVYSNKPIDDLKKVVLKKKSALELKQIEKEFYRQCKERDQKIEKIQFSLNSSLLV